MNDDWTCIICNGKVKAKCRCPRLDALCENGCEYHWSPFHKQMHMGHSDHGTDTFGPDCCVEKEVIDVKE